MTLNDDHRERVRLRTGRVADQADRLEEQWSTADRVARGYSQGSPRADRHPPFTVDEDKEQLLTLRERDRAAYYALPPGVRMAVGSYEAAKQRREGSS